MIQKFLLCAGIITASFAVQAQPLKTPAPSPTQTIKQDFALSSIELTYSRPGMKGRKIFGDLVPYGKVWRTGANSASVLTFGDDVMIGDTKVPAGKYGLLSIPNKDSWIVIISKQTDVTSPAAYKQEMDVVRVNVKPSDLPTALETFGMQFQNIKANTLDLTIAWDKTMVTLPISTDVDKKVMAQINSLMNNDSRPYFNAAMYYIESGKDLNQAVTWLDKAIEQNPKAFWVYHQKANALAKLGKKEEARQIAGKSIELAKEQKNDDYVALNEKLLASLK
ncbi:MAG TPA: DUF2911 domain-containing protein [Flavisolibacter sp.]|jgi:tetratricopeptide (TPR) repeat protein|nr:DUF2911 domain-containing protein [Flavisolibacter sp.]